MKKIIVLFLFIVITMIGNTQCIPKYYKGFTYCIQTEDTLYSSKMQFSSIPEFTGDMNKWFSDSTNYPDTALRANIQGSVWLTFAVEKSGSVSNLKIVHGLYKELNQEAMRVAEKMPKWTPGVINNQFTQAEMIMHIRFVITNAPLPKISTVTESVQDSVATKR